MRSSVRSFAKGFASVGVAVMLGLLAAVPATADSDPHVLIANGDDVPEGSYRFSVKLTMTGIPTANGGRRNSACSGALISSRWIITAGHCFRDADGVRVERPVADLTTAAVGRADLEGTNGEVRTIVAVRQLFTSDIAVAELDHPVYGIRPIRLARTAPEIGQIVRLTGYGSVTGTNPSPSTRLRTGQFTVVSVNETTIGTKGYAPEPNTSPCPYDSGAPYFIEGHDGHVTLVSIESNGPSCPHALEETTARIDVAAKWIRSAIR
jgi:secreted trypsin-like serine protease